MKIEYKQHKKSKRDETGRGMKKFEKTEKGHEGDDYLMMI